MQSIALSLLAFSSLILELGLSRILAVSLWHHFAFLVMSTAVLGYGVAGAVLASQPAWLKRPAIVSELSILAGLSILIGFPILNRLPFDPFGLTLEPLQWVLAIPYLGLLTAPFLSAGLVIGLILTENAKDASRLYAFDLVGAGLGALCAPFLFKPFGGSGAVFLAAAASFGAAIILARSATKRVVVAGGLVLSLALITFGERLVPIRVSANKRAGNTAVGDVLADPKRTIFSGWNEISKLDVIRLGEELFILIDGGVAWVKVPYVRTSISDTPPLDDAASLGYAITPSPSVLVMGSGAGIEILSALTHGATKVVGVEINPGITELVSGKLDRFVGKIFRDPRVETLTDEARSFLERRKDETFDVIVASHTISNAAAHAGALTLAESYTLTIEAFQKQLERLTSRGVFVMTRPESQLPRAFETAREALLRDGARDPSAHLAAFTSGNPFMSVLLVSRSPLASTATTALVGRAAQLSLRPAFLPGLPPKDASWKALGSGSALELERTSGRRLTPATDDRPFFHQRIVLSAMSWEEVMGVFHAGTAARTALEDAPVAEVSLLLVLVESLLVALLAVSWPLSRGAAPSGPLRALVVVFAGLGAGFMFFELGLVHRLSLFLGTSNRAFAVVVGTLLVASGVGARISARWPPRQSLSWALAGVALVGTATIMSLPGLTGAFLGSEPATRVIVAAAAMTPLGLALGMPFPLALRLGDELRAPSGTLALCFGTNGFFSVLGSVATTVGAMTAGFGAVLWTGIAVYALASTLVFSRVRPS